MGYSTILILWAVLSPALASYMPQMFSEQTWTFSLFSSNMLSIYTHTICKLAT